MFKYFILIVLFIIYAKKVNNDLIEDGNIYREKRNSTIVKLKGEDYRHYCKGEKAFVVNMWKLNNCNKKDMDTFKKRICYDLQIFKRYKKNKYNNQIKIYPLNKSLQKCFLKTPANSCKEMLEIAKKSDIQVLFSLNYEKGEFIISYNHGIFDGLSMCKRFQKVINKESEPYEIKYLEPSLKNILYSLTKIHYLPNTNPITVDIEKPIRIEIKMSADKIRNITHKYKCSFNTAYAYVMLKMINFDNVGVGTLTSGIRKKKAFNSYGIIPFVYSKKDKIKNIEKKIDSNSGTSLLSNLFISYSSNYLKKMYQNKIHILLSSIPLCKKEAKIGNMEIDFHSVYMPYHSCPVYVFCGKNGNTLNITISIKNKKAYNNIINNLPQKYIHSIQQD